MTADVLGLVGSTIEQVRFDACVDGGGFGLIYRGRHLGLEEDVAIKCLRLNMKNRANESIREALAGRFRDETKLLYRLSQGSLDIVRCISSGTVVAPTTGELTPYMVLEWLEGRTLSAELRMRRERKFGGRSLEETVELLESAVRGLSHAHAQGIVHRDVKPGNLFLTRTREGIRLKVLDFGLAKILSDEALGIRPSVETAAGMHFCSPSYGAPEQFSPRVGPIGPWTDIYSLALVLLEVMVGEKVRPAGSLADGLLKAIDPETGSPTPSKLGLRLAPAVERLFERAVAQDPRQRPRDATEFWSELREAMRGSASSAPPNGQDVGANGLEVEQRRVQDAIATLTGSDHADAREAAQSLANAFEARERAQRAGKVDLRIGVEVSAEPQSPLSSTLAMVNRPAIPDNPPPPASQKRQITVPIGTTSPLASSIAVAQSPVVAALQARTPPMGTASAQTSQAPVVTAPAAARATNGGSAAIPSPLPPVLGAAHETSALRHPSSPPAPPEVVLSPFAITHAETSSVPLAARSVTESKSMDTPPTSSPAPVKEPSRAGTKIFLALLVLAALAAFWFFAVRH